MRDIEDICSSNLTYDEKIKELKSLKEYTIFNIDEYIKYINEIDKAMDELSKGSYLDKMKNNLDYISHKLLVKIPASLISMGLGVYFTKNFINMAQDPEIELHYSDTDFMTIIFGMCIFDTLSVVSIPETIKDIYNRKLYKEEISSYQRRLK